MQSVNVLSIRAASSVRTSCMYSPAGGQHYRKGVNSTISFKQPSGACLESGLIGRNRREVVIPVYGYESVWTGMKPKELINTTRTVSYPHFARSQHCSYVMSVVTRRPKFVDQDRAHNVSGRSDNAARASLLSRLYFCMNPTRRTTSMVLCARRWPRSLCAR